MTIGNPADTLTYMRAVRLLLGGYGAYNREKRRETNVAVREEILRCCNRVRNHVENVHDSAYRDGNIEVARSCAGAVEEVDALRNDVNVAETGGEHPFFSQQISASKKTINELIDHDLRTLKMLVKAVNQSNELEKEHAASNSKATITAAKECRQIVSSVRGHFSERRAVLRKIK